MRSGCLLPLSLLVAAAVLRTQSLTVFDPPGLRSLRSHTPDILDQDIVESSYNPSLLEVALHTLSLPNYLILRLLMKRNKDILSSLRKKTNKGDENTKYNKRLNFKVY